MFTHPVAVVVPVVPVDEHLLPLPLLPLPPLAAAATPVALFPLRLSFSPLGRGWRVLRRGGGGHARRRDASLPAAAWFVLELKREGNSAGRGGEMETKPSPPT